MDGSAGSAEMAGDMPASDTKAGLSHDNCVEYMVFVVHAREETGKLLPALESIRRRGMQLCEEYTKDYIWQKEAFALEVKSERGLLFLYGSTEYGDCVEDEWLVVFLLRELSKLFAEAWIRVFDGDGEFLFIEAASVVPKWLSPETDAHRAWIHKGELRIIAPGSQAGAKAGSISLPEAVEYLRNKPGELVHSSFVEAEAFYRLEKYPRCLQESMHHALVTIPRRLAYVLHDRPRSVAPAVEAFYLRDPVALKPILAASPALHFPPADLVTVSVRFTRTLFAQLRSQRFDPPPPQWRPLLEAAEMQSSGHSDGPPAKDLLETGMKLTTGFEMLLATAKTSNQRIVREIALVVADLDEDGEDAAALPSDEVIRSWRDVGRHDDDSWLDIDSADFERELEGASGRKRDGSSNKGFGDAAAQADLRKIVERFEGFLNDDRAGLDGALVDEMDEDDEESDEDDDDDGDGGDSGDEDVHVSFDEAEFENMMRQMMGLPGTAGLATPYTEQSRRGVDDEAKRAPEEDKEIQELAAYFESELHSHGALRLDPAAPKRPAQLADGQHSKPDTAPHPAAVPSTTDDESADEEVDIDYNLAKNLLESFKSQTGMPGPAGNILRMMGMSLPRDEDDG